MGLDWCGSLEEFKAAYGRRRLCGRLCLLFRFGGMRLFRLGLRLWSLREWRGNDSRRFCNL